MNELRRDSPSYHRNIEPITQKLHELNGDDAYHVLEIGSGSGQHVARFANEFPRLQFQPTDYDQDNLPSINSWCKNMENVSPALQLDVTKLPWLDKDKPKFDLLLCFNVIHITPWEVTQAIFKGADQHLSSESRMIFYGPYKTDGKHTSESNVEFELWLKEKDNSYGIRNIGDVESEASKNGFSLKQAIAMPANNFMLEFARA
jgi:cyclopropane fatty-acyl-phospholipid synthase-like methyltransferase